MPILLLLLLLLLLQGVQHYQNFQLISNFNQITGDPTAKLIKMQPTTQSIKDDLLSNGQPLTHRRALETDPWLTCEPNSPSSESIVSYGQFKRDLAMFLRSDAAEYMRSTDRTPSKAKPLGYRSFKELSQFNPSDDCLLSTASSMQGDSSCSYDECPPFSLAQLQLSRFSSKLVISPDPLACQVASFLGPCSHAISEEGKVPGLLGIVEAHREDQTPVSELQDQMHSISTKITDLLLAQEQLLDRLLASSVRNEIQHASKVNTLAPHLCYSKTKALIKRPQLEPLILRECTPLCHLSASQHQRIARISGAKQRLLSKGGDLQRTLAELRPIFNRSRCEQEPYTISKRTAKIFLKAQEQLRKAARGIPMKTSHPIRSASILPVDPVIDATKVWEEYLSITTRPKVVGTSFLCKGSWALGQSLIQAHHLLGSLKALPNDVKQSLEKGIGQDAIRVSEAFSSIAKKASDLLSYRRREFAMSYLKYNGQYSLSGIYKLRLEKEIGGVDISQVPLQSRSFKITFDEWSRVTKEKVKRDRSQLIRYENVARAVNEELRAAAKQVMEYGIWAKTNIKRQQVFSHQIQEMTSKLNLVEQRGKTSKYEYLRIDGKRRRISNLSEDMPLKEDSLRLMIRRLEIVNACLQESQITLRSKDIFQCSLRESIRYYTDQKIEQLLKSEKDMMQYQQHSMRANAWHKKKLEEQVVIVIGEHLTMRISNLKLQM